MASYHSGSLTDGTNQNNGKYSAMLTQLRHVIFGLIWFAPYTAALSPCDTFECTPRMPEPTSFPTLIGIFDNCTCRASSTRAVCFGANACQRFWNVPKISTRYFKLSTIGLTSLQRGDLNFLNATEELLVLGPSALTDIGPGTFENLTSLRSLQISNHHNLTRLSQHCFKGLTGLQVLNLANNNFTKLGNILPALKPLTKLAQLVLRENRFESIQEQDFEPVARTLVVLNLMSCQVRYIAPEAFTCLVSLKHLVLRKNKIDANNLREVIHVTAQYTQLKVLDLSNMDLNKTSIQHVMETIGATNITSVVLHHNQLDALVHQIFEKATRVECLDLNGVSALELAPDAFLHLPYLKTLLLSGNSLSAIPKNFILENVTFLDFQHNSKDKLSLPEGAFTNCQKLKNLKLGFNTLNSLQNWIFKGLGNLESLDLSNGTLFFIANDTFAGMRHLKTLILRNNLFGAHHPFVPEIFRGLKNLKTLLLRGCYIKDLSLNPFRYLPQLEYLELEGNQITTITGMDDLTQLKYLDLSRNLIQSWKHTVFSANITLEEVNLNHNPIIVLTTAMVKDFMTLKRVGLQHLLQCDCDLDSTQLVALTRLSIKCFFGDCLKIALITAAAVLVLLVLCSALSWYHFRRQIRYRLFLFKMYITTKQRQENAGGCAYVNYQYDAFVSYSEQDRDFVVSLVSTLEDQPSFLKLCVYERDFEVGTIISQDILECMGKSRKTVLVVSNAFAKSKWCQWETHIAQYFNVFERNNNGSFGNDGLVLIKLGTIDNRLLTPTLKFLLMTRVYLQWEADVGKQVVFWEKLRHVLAPPGESPESTHL